jgi:hypothetical protein
MTLRSNRDVRVFLQRLVSGHVLRPRLSDGDVEFLDDLILYLCGRQTPPAQGPPSPEATEVMADMAFALAGQCLTTIEELELAVEAGT